MTGRNSNLFDCFKRYMLSSDDVVEKGMEITLGGISDAETIKKSFSKYVTNSELKVYDLFLEAQKEAWRKGIKEYIERFGDADVTLSQARFLTEDFDELDKFFLSLSQSRRVRAGLAFQYIIKDLFKRLDYPFSEQQVINGQPDFLLPSIEYYQKFPVDCIIFTVKRTLRERWRQIVTEGTRGLGFYLATIDKSITQNQLGEMASNRIYLVVPVSMKTNTDRYRACANVLSFETFFEDVLDPKMRHWKRDGVI